MPDDKKNLGHHGETAAAFFLKSKGFTILETNYRTKPAEIDIIARDDDTICFIEVKTRGSLKKGLPKESVTVSKQKKILLGACFYLKQKKWENSRIRFDVVEVYKKQDGFDINLIKNAFQAH
ncbi:MAG: YraN family protein [Proteobacteria bacterium]|nr:YraN family protein [Pseudomonadota bacterium]MBU1583453.1 YraN family protein [Pseudomonadota bacterium]MBU2454351.1 YraN family protein [Pseudomonadota bacterium]MBU2631605.1 YraN family protein [Pseudomonadota bacterium]